MRSKDRNFYWRTADSKTNGATSLLYGQNQLPFKTEMAFRMVGSNYGVTLIIVGFSFQILQRKKSHFKCLAGIVYALYSSAFDNEDEHAINDTQNDEPGLPTQRQSELDLKTYNLSDNKGSTPETENPQSAQQCLHSDLAQGMMIWNRSLAEMKEKTHSGEQLPVKVSSTDDDAVGLCIDECDGDTRKVPVKDAQQHAVAGSTNTHATAPVDGSSFDSYSAPPVLAEIEEVAKEAEKHAERHSQYQVPSWQPHSPFSYPVASIPIRQTVNCNLIFPDNFSDVTHLADGSNSNIFSCILRGESVIVKMIKVQAEKDRTAVHEYDIEFGLLARIDHPNIIRVLGAGMLPRRFLVLEQLGGGTLTQIMAQRQKSTFTSMIFRKPTFTYEELLLRARDLAAALDYLHFKCHSGASILHRGEILSFLFATR